MLYYIDNNPEKIINHFYPRIPQNRLMYEDNTTKRICLATTLEGCVFAASWGGEEGFVYNPCQLFRVYEFNESEIMESNLILSDELKYKVQDADDTGEVWVINQTMVPTNTYLATIRGITNVDDVEDDFSGDGAFLYVDLNIYIESVSNSIIFSGTEFVSPEPIDPQVLKTLLPYHRVFEDCANPIYIQEINSGENIIYKFSEPVTFCKQFLNYILTKKEAC